MTRRGERKSVIGCWANDPPEEDVAASEVLGKVKHKGSNLGRHWEIQTGPWPVGRVRQSIALSSRDS